MVRALEANSPFPGLEYFIKYEEKILSQFFNSLRKDSLDNPCDDFGSKGSNVKILPVKLCVNEIVC